MIEKLHSINLDFIGISASLLCAVHCALLPIIISFSAISGNDHKWHDVMDFVFLPIALILIFYSLVKSIKKHHKYSSIFFAIAGLILFFAGKLIFHHPHFVFTTLGGLLIAYAHFNNWVLLRKTQV